MDRNTLGIIFVLALFGAATTLARMLKLSAEQSKIERQTIMGKIARMIVDCDLNLVKYDEFNIHFEVEGCSGLRISSSEDYTKEILKIKTVFGRCEVELFYENDCLVRCHLDNQELSSVPLTDKFHAESILAYIQRCPTTDSQTGLS